MEEEPLPSLPPFVIARILSYNVETTKDVAKLRLLSREVVRMLPSLTGRHHFIRCPVKSTLPKRTYERALVNIKDDYYDPHCVSLGEEWLYDAIDTYGDRKLFHLLGEKEDTFVSSCRFVGEPISISIYTKIQRERDMNPVTKTDSENADALHDEPMEDVEAEDEDEAEKEAGAGAQEENEQEEEEKVEEKEGEEEEESEMLAFMKGGGLKGEERYEALKRVCHGFRDAKTLPEIRSLCRETIKLELTFPSTVDDAQEEEEEDFEPDVITGFVGEEDWTYRYPVLLQMVIPKDSSAIVGKIKDPETGKASILKLKVGAKEHREKAKDKSVFVLDEFRKTYDAVVVLESSTSYALDLMICLTTHYDQINDYQHEHGDTSNTLVYDHLWNRFQAQLLVEGVTIVDGAVGKDFSQRLGEQITALGTVQEEEDRVDYHPHSNGIVRDLVHPALFSYVKDVSPLTRSTSEVDVCIFPNLDYGALPSSEEEEGDFWGRSYETSKYQWLPTYFGVSMDGKCTIEDYINNLVPREKYSDLYGSLAKLFELALPYIESVYSYVRAVRPRLRSEDGDQDYNDELYPMDNVRYASIRGQKVQVITKIVDYELKPGQTYEGVWHVEGMSHEEIVCTCLYVLDRDDGMDGGEIEFKRAFLRDEANFVFSSVNQMRHPAHEQLIAEGLHPLGTVETRKGRLVVFPNSHVHRVKTLRNVLQDQGSSSNAVADSKTVATAKRRIVVFFIVNPLKRIVSTREVAPQQDYAGGTMSMADAKEHRLQLMRERKYKKQDWNVREIELCEH